MEMIRSVLVFLLWVAGVAALSWLFVTLMGYVHDLIGFGLLATLFVFPATALGYLVGVLDGGGCGADRRAD